MINDYRWGIGFDVHAFSDDPNRKLILGGVAVEYDRGLAGHSDADVLIHAIIDALFGAAGMEDIGRHFPDNDPQYKDIDSSVLLVRTLEIIRAKGWEISNVDATVIAQKPKLAGFLEEMQKRLAGEMDIGTDRVNIKATTTEYLGFIGRGEGIGAMAVASVYK